MVQAPAVAPAASRAVLYAGWRPMYGVVAASVLALLTAPTGAFLMLRGASLDETIGDVFTAVMLLFVFYGIIIVPAIISATAGFFGVVYAVAWGLRILRPWLFPAAGAVPGLILAVVATRGDHPDSHPLLLAYIVMAPALAGLAFALVARPRASRGAPDTPTDG